MAGVLCVHKRDDTEDYFTLPGGGQEPGETLPEALRRECLEEIDADVLVDRLRYVRDYIGRNHPFAAMDDIATRWRSSSSARSRPELSRGSAPGRTAIM